MSEAALKRRVREQVDAELPRLIALSEALHADPETAWNEHRASARLCDELESRGFAVTPAYLGLETAFLATAGTGAVRIGICAEYDALPGLGHACGHNLIAAIAVGVAAALAPLADELGITVEVYGTPAEEGGGGKIELLDRGAFAGLDLAVMAHPGPVDVAEARPFAVAHSHVQYDGKAAHAGAYPEQGVNANDAFVVAQVAIGLLRQQLPHSARVHGIQTVGGQAPNAIPNRTEGRWYVRAETLAELEHIEQRVNRCFEAGALASGTTLTNTPESKRYSEFRTDERALGHYRGERHRAGEGVRHLWHRDDEPGVDRYGQCLADRPGHPPVCRRRQPARDQPPAGVRRGMRRAGGGESAAGCRRGARTDRGGRRAGGVLSATRTTCDVLGPAQLVQVRRVDAAGEAVSASHGATAVAKDRLAWLGSSSTDSGRPDDLFSRRRRSRAGAPVARVGFRRRDHRRSTACGQRGSGA
ncbi:amidohydrolase, partial [Leifsonia poae]|uniref:amidohydrolase n=1 Tax=Leifsonia poae TaxID=110933 RepID=UPI0027DEAFA8